MCLPFSSEPEKNTLNSTFSNGGGLSITRLRATYGRLDRCAIDMGIPIKRWKLPAAESLSTTVYVAFQSYKLKHVVVELLICWLEHQCWSVVELQSINLSFAIWTPVSTSNLPTENNIQRLIQLLLIVCHHNAYNISAVVCSIKGRVQTCSDFS
jgi:hypothetical protein